MRSALSTRRLALLLVLGALLTAFPFIVDSKTWGEFVNAVFSWAPEHPPEFLEGLFGMLMMPFLVFPSFSFLSGTAMFFVVIGSVFLRRERPLVPPALLILLLGALYVFVQTLLLLAVPVGSLSPPIGLALFAFFFVMGVTVLGLTAAICSFPAAASVV